MRIITPNFPCPKCGSKIGDCTTDEVYDSWGLSRCTNEKCDYYIDAHELVNNRGQRIREI